MRTFLVRLSLVSLLMTAMLASAGEPAERAMVLSNGRLELQAAAPRMPGPDEVLVRIHAAAIAEDGRPKPAFRQLAPAAAPAGGGAQGGLMLLPASPGVAPTPGVPGTDAAGVIAAVGPNVAWRVGAEVIVYSPQGGAYADHLTVPVAAIVAKPRNVTFEEAAALPTSILTASVLLDGAAVAAGQRVLVHLGAGPTGFAAIQFAKFRGAVVAVVAPARFRSYLLAIGADQVVDADRERFEDLVKDVDVVFAADDLALAQRSIATMKSGGIVVSPSGEVEAAARTARNIRSLALTSREADIQAVLGNAVRLVDRGDIDLNVERAFPLSLANEATEFAATAAKPHGHVVLRMR